MAVPLPASPSSGEQPLGPVAVAVVAPAPSSSAKEARLDEVAGLCLGSFEATELPTARSPIVPSPSSPLPEKEAPPAAPATSPAPAPASTAAAVAPSPAETTNGHVTSPATTSTDDSTPATAAAPHVTAENGASSAAPEVAVRKPVVNAWGKGAPAILQKYMEAQKKAAAQQQQQRPPAPTAAAVLRHFDEVRLMWDASFAHAALRGLHNEGNTCFLNATVQCLLACPPFIGFLRSLRGRGLPCPAPTLTELVRFAEAFELEKKANTQLVPLAAKAHFAAVIKKLAGTPGRQEDAHEFLSLLLDTVHEELRAGSAKARAGGGSGESGAHHKTAAHNETNEWNEVGRKNKTSKLRTAEFEDTAVTRIFGCKLRSCLKSRGAKQSITQELFNALPLDVSVHQIRSLDDALLGFMSAESLDWEVRASKEYKFERMPGVLVVHLKRFAFSAAGGDKIAKHIEFPERLVIPTKLLGPHAGGSEKERRSYDLFGVVEHHGHTLQSGHYTASIKRDQHWYHVDDTTINPTTIQTVLRRQAYLLFYLRASPSSSSH